MAAWVNGCPEPFCSLHRDRGAAQRSPEAVHSLTNRLACYGDPAARAHHRGQDTLTFSLKILYCFPLLPHPFMYASTNEHASLIFILVVIFSFVLQESNIQKSHDTLIYQKMPFIHVSLLLLCAEMFQATSLRTPCIGNQMKGEAGK